MKVFVTDQFPIPLPSWHTFPVAKYARLREVVAASGVVAPEDLITPAALTEEEILRVHESGYVRRVLTGSLTASEEREIGLPWSTELVERSRRSSGGTLAACRAALLDGVAVNLAGGTHHAHAGKGGGYCVFNDAAIAARALQAEGRVRRLVVLDCDVHHGDGTASIFADDPSVFTFSIHGARNYPLRKPPGDLDVALDDGTGDERYLAALDEGLRRSILAADAQLAIYLAGADPFEGDRLGRMALTKAGLAERDRRVFAACHTAGLPVAVTMGGGYGRDLEETVAIHAQTIIEAAKWASHPGRLGRVADRR